jgi:hypothetical protein
MVICAATACGMAVVYWLQGGFARPWTSSPSDKPASPPMRPKPRGIRDLRPAPRFATGVPRVARTKGGRRAMVSAAAPLHGCHGGWQDVGSDPQRLLRGKIAGAVLIADCRC